MLKKYDPLKNKMFQVMNEKGEIVNPEFKPDLPDKQVVEAYKKMLFAREADLMTVSYQRQGRTYTYPPNIGQEAIAIGTGFAMKEEDWLVPAYRELGLYFMRGITLKEMFLFWGGNEKGSAMSQAKNVLPLAVPIASQLLHAVGVGYAIQYRNEKKAVFTFVGDGGTSEGDFHEAMNFASVWNAPVVFTVQNNQYAISVPRHKQTRSINIAVKAIAYGIPGLMVDGNDFFAVLAAEQFARDRAVQGKGPMLIEAVTYRKGAHTTSDDPKKYRTQDEEKEWGKKDPLLRLKKYLMSKDLWDEKEEEKLIEQYRREIDEQFREFEKEAAYTLDEVFDYMYEEMPDELKKQKIAYEKFLNWKELRS